MIIAMVMFCKISDKFTDFNSSDIVKLFAKSLGGALFCLDGIIKCDHMQQKKGTWLSTFGFTTCEKSMRRIAKRMKAQNSFHLIVMNFQKTKIYSTTLLSKFK